MNKTIKTVVKLMILTFSLAVIKDRVMARPILYSASDSAMIAVGLEGETLLNQKYLETINNSVSPYGDKQARQYTFWTIPWITIATTVFLSIILFMINKLSAENHRSLNHIHSILNSQVGISSIENLSFNHRELNQFLILQVSVYVAYEVLCGEAYKILKQAVWITNGLSKSLEPFVFLEEFSEVYITCRLNAYIDWEYFQDKSLQEIEQLRSQLGKNIRDCCLRAGIMIFTLKDEIDLPNYEVIARN